MEFGKLSPEELSARWKGRITVETLANWRWEDKGPRWQKIGNRVWYDIEDVIAYILSLRK